MHKFILPNLFNQFCHIYFSVENGIVKVDLEKYTETFAHEPVTHVSYNFQHNGQDLYKTGAFSKTDSGDTIRKAKDFVDCTEKDMEIHSGYAINSLIRENPKYKQLDKQIEDMNHKELTKLERKQLKEIREKNKVLIKSINKPV